MAKQMAQEDEVTVSQPGAGRDPQVVPTTPRGISYHPTRWALVNRALDLVDTVSGGKAGIFQRLFTYLVIGGTAALVNLIVFGFLVHSVAWPHDQTLHIIFAQAVAYEVSILANFIPNDYFTFRHMSGHNRSWGARCLRFHLTSLSGIAVTFILFTAFSVALHSIGVIKSRDTEAVVAQALALILATFYNFTAHHLFTYRHTAAPAK